jgi:glycosyltransferase involved in cell wall biosynthesis
MHGGPTFFETGHRLQMLKERWAFHIADELCAVSQCVADGTRRMLNLGGRHIEVIPNPIETRLFAPAPGHPPEQEGLLVFAGTVAERKGIRQLIQAMPRIVAEVPHARLEIYGGEVIDPVPAVPLATTLNNLLPPSVASHVEWKGRVARAELPRAIQRASICVYPSHFEAMPIAWLEGLASGKAVVASRTGPGPEIIDDGETGLLCDPHDPDSIAGAVIRLLNDSGLRRRLGDAARRMVRERYELEPIIDRNEAYYRRITGTAS